jgi:pimeloyl-ACP methyl ester carboxylesterase
MTARHPIQGSLSSRDGTSIAFEQSGDGPAVVLVAAALSDRSDTRRLARRLAEHFMVINYDRRGRGLSTDTQPYAVAREIEDLEALIDAAGGSACVFGSSSGAVLALDAAGKLGGKIRKLALFEPPFIIDSSRPPLPRNFAKEVDELVAADKRAQAVKLFFSEAMGIPRIGVVFMRFMPGWSRMVGMAHTIAYDLAITQDTQTGAPLPTARWSSASCPTLVLTGAKSETFFRAGAEALVAMLPAGQHRTIEGQGHAAVVMGSKVLAPILTTFFRDRIQGGGRGQSRPD